MKKWNNILSWFNIIFGVVKLIIGNAIVGVLGIVCGIVLYDKTV